MIATDNNPFNSITMARKQTTEDNNLNPGDDQDENESSNNENCNHDNILEVGATIDRNNINNSNLKNNSKQCQNDCQVDEIPMPPKSEQATNSRGANKQCNNQAHQNDKHIDGNDCTSENRSFDSIQQSRCYLCDIPKQEYSLIRTFSEVICRGCLNYEGPNRVEHLIKIARCSKRSIHIVKYQQSNGSIDRVTKQRQRHYNQQSHINNLNNSEDSNLQQQRQSKHNFNKTRPIYESILPINHANIDDHRRSQQLNNSNYVDQSSNIPTLLPTLSAYAINQSHCNFGNRSPRSTSVSGESMFFNPITNSMMTTTTSATSSTTNPLHFVPVCPSPKQVASRTGMQIEHMSSPQPFEAIEQITNPLSLKTDFKCTQQETKQQQQQQKILHHMQQIHQPSAVADKPALAAHLTDESAPASPLAQTSFNIHPHQQSQLFIQHQQIPYANNNSYENHVVVPRLGRNSTEASLSNANNNNPEVHQYNESSLNQSCEKHNHNAMRKQTMMNSIPQLRATSTTNLIAQLDSSNQICEPISAAYYLHHVLSQPHYYIGSATNGEYQQSQSKMLSSIPEALTSSSSQQPTLPLSLQQHSQSIQQNLTDGSKTATAMMTANLYASHYPITTMDPYHLTSIREQGGSRVPYCMPSYYNYHHTLNGIHQGALPSGTYDAIITSTPLSSHSSQAYDRNPNVANVSRGIIGHTIGKRDDSVTQTSLDTSSQPPLGSQSKIGSISATYPYMSEQNLRRLLDRNYDFVQHLNSLNPTISLPHRTLKPCHEATLFPQNFGAKQRQNSTPSPLQNLMVARTSNYDLEQKRYLQQQTIEKTQSSSKISPSNSEKFRLHQRPINLSPQNESQMLIDARIGQNYSSKIKNTTSCNFDDIIECGRMDPSPSLPDGSRSNGNKSPSSNKIHGSAANGKILKDHSDCCYAINYNRSKQNEDESKYERNTETTTAKKTLSLTVRSNVKCNNQSTPLKTCDGGVKHLTGSSKINQPSARTAKRGYSLATSAIGNKRITYNPVQAVTSDINRRHNCHSNAAKRATSTSTAVSETQVDGPIGVSYKANSHLNRLDKDHKNNSHCDLIIDVQVLSEKPSSPRLPTRMIPLTKQATSCPASDIISLGNGDHDRSRNTNNRSRQFNSNELSSLKNDIDSMNLTSPSRRDKLSPSDSKHSNNEIPLELLSHHHRRQLNSNLDGNHTMPVSSTLAPISATSQASKEQQQSQTPIKCLLCNEHLADRHFVQCPSVVLHKFCFACSKVAIELQQLNNWRQNSECVKAYCPSGKRCYLANEPTPWTFMNSEIETIFRESSRQSCSSSKSISTNNRLSTSLSSNSASATPAPVSSATNCNGPAMVKQFLGNQESNGKPVGKQNSQNGGKYGHNETSSNLDRNRSSNQPENANSKAVSSEFSQQKGGGSSSGPSSDGILL